MSRNVIHWTPEMLARFKKAYARAVREKYDTFEFEENEFVTGYAMYLIEYLEGELK